MKTDQTVRMSKLVFIFAGLEGTSSDITAYIYWPLFYCTLLHIDVLCDFFLSIFNIL